MAEGTPGHPLDAETRGFFEPRFAHDFGAVRVHTDGDAAKSAEAIGAQAFTHAGHIYFGAGQYAPQSANGKRLLAHELAHVIQQDPAPRESLTGQPRLPRAPSDRILRKTTPEDDKKKREAIDRHTKQEQHVADLLKKALTLKKDPKQPLSADNLFRNTAELVNEGKAGLFVLTPTHYSTDDNPFFFDVRHPLSLTAPHGKSDYPVDNTHPDITKMDLDTLAVLGLAHPAPGTTGETLPHKEDPLAYQPLPKKEEDPSGTKGSPVPPPKWVPPDIRLYTPDTDIAEDRLRNTLVHEGQHVADMSQQTLPSLTDWHFSLEDYKTEFRAHWIEPPEAPICADCMAAQTRFADAADKAENTNKVQPKTCPDCTPPSSGTKTDFQNRRQESIFWSFVTNPTYNKAIQLDCRYACVADFKKAVDAFDAPRSVNLVNSTRLLALNLELQNLTTTMNADELSKTGFAAAVQKLDEVDWAFLGQIVSTAGKTAKGDRRPSDPFWEILDKNAPDFVKKAMKSWVKSGKPPSASELSRQLSNH